MSPVRFNGRRKVLSALFMILPLTGTFTIPHHIATTSRQVGAPVVVSHLLQTLTLRQKIGQLFMVTVPGTAVDTSTASTMQSIQPGGVILMGNNVANPTAEQVSMTQSGANQASSVTTLRRLTAGLQYVATRTSTVPLLIATDQEGGTVDRITVGLPLFPANSSWGDSPSAATAVRVAAEQTGLGLRDLGITMDLAPVIDVVTNPCNTVIGPRSFGSDTAAVSSLGAAAIDGYHEAGILATAKHFPGYDNACVDAHTSLPVLTTSPDQLATVDFPPFVTAIAHHVDAIMVTHLVALPLDPSGLPASLSPAVIQGTLRGRLGYTGLIMTDDLAMGAISNQWTLSQAAMLAIRAGADELVVTSPLSQVAQAITTIVQAVDQGMLSIQQINAAVWQVLSLKEHAGLFTAAQHGLLTRALPPGWQPTPLPQAPRIPQAAQGQQAGQQWMIWRLPTHDPAGTVRYRLYTWYYRGPHVVSIAQSLPISRGGQRQVAIPLPRVGATYYAVVRAESASGLLSDPSPPARLITHWPRSPIPTIWQAQGTGPQTITWSWRASAFAKVYRATLFHYVGATAHIDRIILQHPRQWITRNLSGGTKYYVKLVALNADGMTSRAALGEAVAPAAALPVYPPQQIGTAGRGPTVLIWHWQAEPGAVSYRYRLFHEDQGRLVVDASDKAKATERPWWYVHALWPGRQYILEVWAINATGHWSQPAFRQAQTRPLPPSP